MYALIDLLIDRFTMLVWSVRFKRTILPLGVNRHIIWNNILSINTYFFKFLQ